MSAITKGLLIMNGFPPSVTPTLSLRSAGRLSRPSPALIAALAGALLSIDALRAQDAPPDAPPPAPTEPMMPPDEPAAQPEALPPPEPRPDAQADKPQAAAGSGQRNLSPLAPPADDAFRFDFADAIDLRLVMDLIIQETGIQIVVTDDTVLTKKLYLPVPVTIPKKKLLEFLASLLEQKGYALVEDTGGVLVIKPSNEVSARLGDTEFATTQVLPTSGLRPSALQQAIATALRQGSSPGAVPQGGGAGNLAYLDDLGVILMSDSPRRIDAVRRVIAALVEEQAKQDITRFELIHIAAPIARQRLLELLGRSAGGRGNVQQFNPNDPNQAVQAGAGGGGSVSNIADRLIPDPQSNALIFRGRPDEQAFITRLLNVIDTPNSLEPKWFAVGGAAAQIAQQAKRQGLGEVITLPSTRGGNSQQNAFDSFQQQLQQAQQPGVFGGNQQQGEQGGPMFVIDPEGRGFMYYGTTAQQERVTKIVEESRELTSAETIVFEFYRLRHSKAEDVAEIIRGLLSNTVASIDSPLLPGVGQNAGGALRRPRLADVSTPATPRPTSMTNTASNPSVTELEALAQSEDIFVQEDRSNNQIVVKAPRRLQKQFERLISKLDLRRPQVYIEAKIVSISATEDFRLAFETQLINANGTGGVLNTNFGLSNNGTSATNILTPKVIGSGLGGITAAIIKSDQVPIVITALANNVDTRILASPQLLVDDNEEAEVSSLNQQPTTTQSQSGSAGTTLTGFNGFESAGPSLKVTPQISEGNYMKLKYEIELSSFTGNPQTIGQSVIPSPKLENKIKSNSVTIPSDSTIVIGGLTFTQSDKTVLKVPLLGDIPIIGQLFRDESTSSETRTLYVFLTPRIMRDPDFEDLRLLTLGPAAGLKPKERGGLPAPEPARIELLEPTNRTPENR